MSGDWPSLLRKAVVKVARQERDELGNFWSSPCELLSADPLKYWQGVLLGQPESRLARMAIDYLSAPASSVDAEHAFSHGALTVTHCCHALSDTSTRNSIVLGGWLKDTNLVPKDELVELFRNKSSRSHLQTSSCESIEMNVSDDSNDTDMS